MTPRNNGVQISVGGPRRCAAAFLRGVVAFAGVAGVIALAVAPVATVAGCKKKAPPPPPPPPPPPKPRAVVPDPVKIDPILQSMHPDARVQFPQAFAPTDEGLARAIITLADKFAKGDADGLKGMLSASSRGDVDALTANGQWDESTKKIEAVRVVGFAGAGNTGVVNIAIQEPGAAYVLSWAASSTGSGFAFDALPAVASTKPRAADWDGQPVDGSIAAGVVAPEEAGGPGLKGSDPNKPAAEAPEAAGGGGTTKRTPHGPVTIPGGG